MKHPASGCSGPTRLLFGFVAASGVWFAAFAIEGAARMMAGLFAPFGADLPNPTRLTIDAVHNYVPWIIAATSTLIIVYLGLRASAYFLHACTLVAAVAAVLTSCVALALVLPAMKCGVAWPEWPQPETQSSGSSGKAPNAARKQDTPKGARAGSCPGI